VAGLIARFGPDCRQNAAWQDLGSSPVHFMAYRLAY
jgi:hypothetical protein